MSASQNNATLTLNQQDTNGVNVLNRVIGAIEYAGVVGRFGVGILTDASEHQQTFPSTITTVFQYYFKNTHATAKITVAWTPAGGAKSTIQVVQPGGILAFWFPVVTSGGFTALYYTSDIANGTFEDFIGG